MSRRQRSGIASVCAPIRSPPWVLRVGHLRVYYEVRARPAVVTVRAIGIKERNCVRIGGEEVDLS